MQQEHLVTYLNDHLAGSVAAVQLLAHLKENTSDPGQRIDIADLISEIEEDRDILRALMTTLQADESSFKKAGAWLAEKVTHLKLRLGDTTTSALGQLETFEMLSLGIEGKILLWKSLAIIRDSLPAFPHNIAMLEAKARRQREHVEDWRIEAASKAFA